MKKGGRVGCKRGDAVSCPQVPVHIISYFRDTKVVIYIILVLGERTEGFNTILILDSKQGKIKT